MAIRRRHKDVDLFRFSTHNGGEKRCCGRYIGEKEPFIVMTNIFERIKLDLKQRERERIKKRISYFHLIDEKRRNIIG